MDNDQPATNPTPDNGGAVADPSAPATPPAEPTTPPADNPPAEGTPEDSATPTV
jgi:hypothetical protein